MKKLLALALAAIMLLSVLPVFAADRTTVVVDTHVNVDEKLMVIIKSSEGFTGATLEIGGISSTLTASGEGSHMTKLDLSHITSAGNKTLTVTANYSADSDIITKQLIVKKNKSTVTSILYSNINTTTGWGSATENTFEKLDTSGNEMKLQFVTGGSNSAYIGRQETQNGNINPKGSMYYLEGELLFKNGDSLDNEAPKGRCDLRFRQDRDKSVSSGYPTDSSKDPKANHDDNAFQGIFNSNGKLKDGTLYYTNKWYKFLVSIDTITTKQSGDLQGGVKVFVAEEDGSGGYNPYKLVAEAPNYVLNNIQQWRWEIAMSDVSYNITFKNFKFTENRPYETWNMEYCSFANNKINLTFSEDIGEITGDILKLCNPVGDSLALTSITKTGTNVYEIIPDSTLHFGTKYDIMLKNGIKSSGGAVGFAEPSADADSDGFWNLSSITVPKYPLNSQSLNVVGSDISVVFNNTDISGKYVCVCFHDANASMVDFAGAVTDSIADGGTVGLTRNNNAAYTDVVVYVYDYNTTTGGITLFDICEY